MCNSFLVSAREVHSATYIHRKYNECRVCTPESFQRTRTAGMLAFSPPVPVITPHLHHILNFSVVSNLVGRPSPASNKAYWLHLGHTEHVQTHHRCCTASTLVTVRGKKKIKILYYCHNRDDPGNYFHNYYKKPKKSQNKKKFYIIVLVTILTVFL